MKKLIKPILVIALLIISTNTALAKTKKVKVKTLNDYIHKHCSKHCIDSQLLRRQVKLASKKHHVPEKLLMAVMKVESRFNHKAYSSGNYGLMQIHAIDHLKKISMFEIYDIARNIDVGTEILGNCLESNKNRIKDALSCYKGGYSYEYQEEVKLAMNKMANLIM